MTKKVKVHLAIIGSALLLLACAVYAWVRIYRPTVKEAEAHFLVFEERLKQVADRYGVEMVKTLDEPWNHSFYAKYTVMLSDSGQEAITIRLEAYTGIPGQEDWDIIEKERCIEWVSLDYHKQDGQQEGGFRIDLFAALANCVSRKKLSDKILESFLDEPTEKYFLRWEHGAEFEGDAAITRGQDFSLGISGPSLVYKLYDDGVERLVFSGTTEVLLSD